MTRECPLGTGACRNCGQVGHYMRDCPVCVACVRACACALYVPVPIWVCFSMRLHVCVGGRVRVWRGRSHDQGVPARHRGVQELRPGRPLHARLPGMISCVRPERLTFVRASSACALRILSFGTLERVYVCLLVRFFVTHTHTVHAHAR